MIYADFVSILGKLAYKKCQKFLARFARKLRTNNYKLTIIEIQSCKQCKKSPPIAVDQ